MTRPAKDDNVSNHYDEADLALFSELASHTDSRLFLRVQVIEGLGGPQGRARMGCGIMTELHD